MTAVTTADRSVAPILTVRGLTKRYGGIVACSDVTFDLAVGEIAGIIGPNGAGKSTLFDCITGFARIDDGEVTFEGRRIETLEADQTNRRGIARTFQNMRVFDRMSLLENVMVGAFCRTSDPRIAKEKALGLLEQVGLTVKAEAGASELSTGQRKRLELARALATEPRLLLMDEITGGVDPTAIPGLLALVSSLRATGLALLVIEHNMKVVHQLCERIIAMDLGTIIADGPASDVANDPAVIEAYLGRAYVGSR